MKINLLDLQTDVLEALRSRGHTDSAIEQMTWDQAFDEFCMWEGLVNWGPTLRAVMANLKNSSQ
jgi:hypothetical protein